MLNTLHQLLAHIIFHMLYYLWARALQIFCAFIQWHTLSRQWMCYHHCWHTILISSIHSPGISCILDCSNVSTSCQIAKQCIIEQNFFVPVGQMKVILKPFYDTSMMMVYLSITHSRIMMTLLAYRIYYYRYCSVNDITRQLNITAIDLQMHVSNDLQDVTLEWFCNSSIVRIHELHLLEQGMLMHTSSQQASTFCRSFILVSVQAHFHTIYSFHMHSKFSELIHRRGIPDWPPFNPSLSHLARHVWIDWFLLPTWVLV